jgi:hypothetical protein
MCVVSMVGDHFGDKWEPFKQPIPSPVGPFTVSWPTPGPTQAEFEALKKEVLDMKELLKRAKIYDEKNNEPNCEIEDKMDFLRKVAALVGVDLDDVFKPKQ